jgi:hypothetical protein
MDYWGPTTIPPIPFSPRPVITLCRELGVCPSCKSENCAGVARPNSCQHHTLCFVCGGHHQFVGCPKRHAVSYNSAFARHIRFGVRHGYFAPWTMRLLGLPSTYPPSPSSGDVRPHPSPSSSEHIGHGRPATLSGFARYAQSVSSNVLQYQRELLQVSCRVRLDESDTRRPVWISAFGRVHRL